MGGEWISGIEYTKEELEDSVVGFGEHAGLKYTECFEQHPEWCQAFYDGTDALTPEESFYAGFFLEWLDQKYRPEMYDGAANFDAAVRDSLMEKLLQELAAAEEAHCDEDPEPDS